MFVFYKQQFFLDNQLTDIYQVKKCKEAANQIASVVDQKSMTSVVSQRLFQTFVIHLYHSMSCDRSVMLPCYVQGDPELA
jgi:hypothetical protein